MMYAMGSDARKPQWVQPAQHCHQGGLEQYKSYDRAHLIQTAVRSVWSGQPQPIDRQEPEGWYQSLSAFIVQAAHDVIHRRCFAGAWLAPNEHAAPKSVILCTCNFPQQMLL